MKNICLILIILFISSIVLYSQETEQIGDNSALALIEKMNNYTEEKKSMWSYNPFRTTELERLMIGWQDPNANITRFWIGNLFNAEKIYSNPNFFIDKIMLYMTPTLATELNVIPFETGRFRFNIGVGFLLDFNMLVYSGMRQRHGANLITSDNMQVEVFLDMFIDDTWKVRFMPIRHRCDHNHGDYYGDPALYNAYIDDYGDTGYENMGVQVFNVFGWFTFYGGMEWNMNWIIPEIPSTFQTIFAAHIGTDIRFPIWGNINLIAGFYLEANYREYNEKYKTIDPVTLLSSSEVITKTYQEWYPLISVGLGIEIDRYTIGIKYLRRKAEQIGSQNEIEEKLGFECTLII